MPPDTQDPTTDPTTGTTTTDPTSDPTTVDLFEVGADLLAEADYPAEIVAQIRDSFDYAETFTDRRLRIIGEQDPDTAMAIQKEIVDETASKAADAERESEQQRLDALDDEARRIEQARLDVEKAEAIQAEFEQENSRSVFDLAGELAATPNHHREDWWAGRSAEEVTALRDLQGVIPPIDLPEEDQV
jgi:hypothetical protein